VHLPVKNHRFGGRQDEFFRTLREGLRWIDDPDPSPRVPAQPTLRSETHRTSALPTFVPVASHLPFTGAEVS
jgi:hypothetical protein